MVEKLAFSCGISEMKLKESLCKEKIISVWLKKSTLNQVMKNTTSFKNSFGQNTFLTVDTDQAWTGDLSVKASLIVFLNPV